MTTNDDLDRMLRVLTHSDAPQAADDDDDDDTGYTMDTVTVKEFKELLTNAMDFEMARLRAALELRDYGLTTKAKPKAKAKPRSTYRP